MAENPYPDCLRRQKTMLHSFLGAFGELTPAEGVAYRAGLADRQPEVDRLAEALREALEAYDAAVGWGNARGGRTPVSRAQMKPLVTRMVEKSDSARAALAAYEKEETR